MTKLVPIKPLRFAVSLLLCALAGCGGSNAPGPPSTISDLSITPSSATVGTTTTFTGTLHLTDPSGDESEIDGTITPPGGQPQAFQPTMLQGALGQKSVPVEFIVAFSPPLAGSYQVSVYIKDADGQPSNTLTTTITAK
jgi:hypothetical protein